MQNKTELSGKFLDTNGRVGTMRVEIGPDGQAVIRASVAERDGRHLEHESEVRVSREGVRTRLAPMAQDSKGGWQVDLAQQEAGSYAKTAHSGTYRVTGQGGELPLSNGVMILWEFR
jgi:hypothetical protein